MKGQKQFDRFVAENPHSHRFFFERPHYSRRKFFQWMGAGLSGAVLAGNAQAGEAVASAGVTTQNTAKNVIFVLLSGAISHVDTFDFKQSVDTPMDVMKPETINGIVWPTGIMPKLAGNIPDMAIARSAKSWALQHSLAQTWTQIGRSPAAALGDIAPNIGSIVAAEKEPYRLSSDIFPTFLALNSGAGVGSGYLSSAYAPLSIDPSAAGLPDTTNPDGQSRFDSKYAFLASLDGSLRSGVTQSEFRDLGKFYESGKSLMYNSAVDQAFRFTDEESTRYGSSSFGNACLVSAKVLAADKGTRYIQIIFGGWDDHQTIYTDLPPRAKQLDDGLATLMADLKSSGLLNETLIVVQGEFGRTPGPVTAQDGRDHYLQQFVMFAGAKVKGGRALGSTDATGAQSTTYGWSRDRDIRPEDVEATIYSALGIDWTTIRYDDPFGRGFEYVPFSKDDLYGPINELWS